MRIVKFILLKVLEIGGFFGIPYLVGNSLWIPVYLKRMDYPFQKCFLIIWGWGLFNLSLIIGVSCIIVGISFLIRCFIRKNWELAGKCWGPTNERD